MKRRRRAWMTFVIVGGGPTGVELAGTLAEVSRQTLARDFRHINTASARVILVEAGPRVLAAYTEDLSEAARQQLERLGVSVWTGVQVTGIDADGVCIGPERVHAAHGALGRRGRRLAPGRDARRPARPRRPRAGSSPSSPSPAATTSTSSATWPTSSRTGPWCPAWPRPRSSRASSPPGMSSRPSTADRASHSTTSTRGCSPPSAGARRSRKIGRFKTSGFLAWLLWLFVHILFLIGFRNRLVVMIQWAWSYLTFDRGARLITAPLKEPLLEVDPSESPSCHDRPLPRPPERLPGLIDRAASAPRGQLRGPRRGAPAATRAGTGAVTIPRPCLASCHAT